MKLLLVFISALVLVAHGNIIKLQPGSPQELAGYSVEEADDAGPSVYAVQVSNPEAVRVFSAEEEQRAGSPQESQRAIENPEVRQEPVIILNRISAPVPRPSGRTDVEIDAVPETEPTSSESADSRSQRSCNYRACDQRCRRLGFTGGACVHGRCKCNLNFLNAEDDVTETEESQRGCNFRACNQQCRRFGFTGGACVRGRCKCNSFLNAEDPSSMNSTTSNEDEDEDPNLVLRTSEGELTLSSLRACNTVRCNDMCHRLNYAGGMCRSGVCQCY